MKNFVFVCVALFTLVVLQTAKADVAVKIVPRAGVVVTTADCTADCTAATPRYRYVRPWRIAPAVPTVTVVRAEAPAYKVVEKAATPWAVRGVFRDRVVIPRRGGVSVVAE